MALAERPMGSILYHQKRSAILYCEIQHAHNVRMSETCQRLCLLHEAGGVLVAELCIKDFKGGEGLEVDMLAQVDLGKASLAEEASKLVVAQLLTLTPSTIGHHSTSSDLFPWYNFILRIWLLDVPDVSCQMCRKNPYPRAPANCP